MYITLYHYPHRLCQIGEEDDFPKNIDVYGRTVNLLEATIVNHSYLVPELVECPSPGFGLGRLGEREGCLNSWQLATDLLEFSR